MKNIIYLVFTSLLFSSTAIASSQEIDAFEFEQSCKRWAKEDGVSKENLAEFLDDCIDIMKKDAVSDFEENSVEKYDKDLEEDVTQSAEELYEESQEGYSRQTNNMQPKMRVK
ncbi:MAG: hypothetical protein HQL68_10940 [Magnetococcales bacterium]|nr:hypothetical protein [Magnetococcales bacterium]